MTSPDPVPVDRQDVADQITAASTAFSQALSSDSLVLALWGEAVVGYRQALRLLGIDPDTGQLRGPYKRRM